MARQMFIGFDWGWECSVPGYTGTDAPSLPFGCGYFTVSLPNASIRGSVPNVTPWQIRTIEGRAIPSGACMGASLGMGYPFMETSVTTNIKSALENYNTSSYADQRFGVNISKSVCNIDDEAWISFDLGTGSSLSGSGSYTMSNMDNPAAYMRGEPEFQIVRWGDVTIRLRRIFNVTGINPGGTPAPTQTADWQFEVFNGATSIGTVTAPVLINNAAADHWSRSNWFFFKVRIKLHPTQGRVDLNIDGNTLSVTGLNTVSTTPLSSATSIFVGRGALGYKTNADGGGPVWLGGQLDNILIDNASFPAGRPTGCRAVIGTDDSASNWAAVGSGATTLSNAIATYGDGKFARGTGVNATATFNIPDASTWTAFRYGSGTISIAGLGSNLLGYEIVAAEASNLDGTKRLRMGARLSGQDRFGNLAAQQTLPTAPSFTNSVIDQTFYRQDGSDYPLADLYNTKPLLGVV